MNASVYSDCACAMCGWGGMKYDRIVHEQIYVDACILLVPWHWPWLGQWPCQCQSPNMHDPYCPIVELQGVSLASQACPAKNQVMTPYLDQEQCLAKCFVWRKSNTPRSSGSWGSLGTTFINFLNCFWMVQKVSGKVQEGPRSLLDPFEIRFRFTKMSFVFNIFAIVYYIAYCIAYCSVCCSCLLYLPIVDCIAYWIAYCDCLLLIVIADCLL